MNRLTMISYVARRLLPTFIKRSWLEVNYKILTNYTDAIDTNNIHCLQIQSSKTWYMWY